MYKWCAECNSTQSGNYCYIHGTKLLDRVTCDQCGKALHPIDRFCPECGKGVEKAKEAV